MAAAQMDDRPNIGDVRTCHEHQEARVRLAEESESRLVNGSIAAAGVPIMIRGQETFSLLAWISWDLKSYLHSVGHKRRIRKQITQHHRHLFVCEVKVTAWLVGGAKDIVMGF